MLKVITPIAILVLINLRELLNATQRTKVMTIYFIIIGISLGLGLLISIDKQPASPTIVFMNIVKALGLGEG